MATDKQANAEPEKKTEMVVFMVRRETKCTDCGTDIGKGALLRLEEERAVCMDCAGMGHLWFLSSGDACVTRRAGKYSTLHPVVLQWSRTRNRYERQGILAEPEAIERAEQECLGDAEVRARRQAREAEKRAEQDAEFVASFAAEVRRLYPNCPPDSEHKIADHACRKYSGRVGRSAAAKALDPEAIALAVNAHIRHVHTEYDDLLARHNDRRLARETVHRDVERIAAEWMGG